MFTITVKYDEKQSTTSQYENVCAGVLIERSNLELHSPEELLQKTTELFALARTAVQRELSGKAQEPQPVPPERRFPDNGQADQPRNTGSNGHGPNGNGKSRPWRGRPDNPPSEKQRTLLHRIAKDRHLGPESIREICERIVGQPVESLDKAGMSKLLEGLINGAAA